MNIDELEYDLPPELIATRPAEPRCSARMLVVRRDSGKLEHAHVRDLPDLLHPDDLLVRNNTAVLAARLVGRRAIEGNRGGGRVEGLYLESFGSDWLVLLTQSGKLQIGEQLHLEGPGSEQVVIRILERRGKGWLVRPEDAAPAEALLHAVGRTPLPPYILRARDARGETLADELDRAWYRTRFADPTRCGSVAAPTAGLHFSDDLLRRLRDRGVGEASVTLHVGEGTFRPVSAARLEDHDMHAEAWHVDEVALAALRSGPGSQGNLVAVGTTTTRLLESLPDPLPIEAASGETDLLIAPGFQFRRVESLLTNFHLPRSTLLALVGAFMGMELMREAYAEAVASRYRFYSYGDAMLVMR
ncbi:MAG: tRNA preQ1(34) S-adenosylmethionine ribosyltransferase-isomerase QueA [Planctomycetes bacterium]|nr:tRNA preQ1(34) S-adenosylmethionine ribosyltransferase-isomerase QueA [Planctomycetota bacterium]